MSSRALSRGKKPPHRGLPPHIDGYPSVAVLCAERYLKIFRRYIPALSEVQADRRGIHLKKPVDRSAEAGSRLFKILPRLARQMKKRIKQASRQNKAREKKLLKPEGIFREIKIYPPVIQNLFTVDKQIDYRRAVKHLPAVKRPLIPLQENG